MDKTTKLLRGKYQFATEDVNYEDYSSGRVLYGTSGATNFPVRFSRELFQRCKYYLEESGKKQPYAIWDAFCGTAYLMTVLGFLHESDIKTIFASDADGVIIETAKKNLSLLDENGLNQRIGELNVLVDKYNKDSHKEALKSANRLKLKIKERVETKVFQFNALIEEIPSDICNIDMVIVDLPYGQLTQWRGLEENKEPAQMFLDNIKTSLDKRAVLAIVSNKKQNITYDGYKKLKTFTLGKRRVWFFQPSLNIDK